IVQQTAVMKRHLSNGTPPHRRINMPRIRTIAVAFALCILGEEQKTERFVKEIEAFEKQEKDKPVPKDAIIFIGSSSMRLWKLDKSFPNLAVVNRGFGGSQLADSVHYAPRLLHEQQPRLVVLYA